MNYAMLSCNAQERFNNLPIIFAFSKKQFAEGCESIGVTDPKTELSDIGGGGFIKRTDLNLLRDVCDANEKERNEFLSDMNNLEEAFRYELGNHEYCITYNDVETWEAVGLDPETATKEQLGAYSEARSDYLSQEH
jgi:hypothetical protein